MLIPVNNDLPPKVQVDELTLDILLYLREHGTMETISIARLAGIPKSGSTALMKTIRKKKLITSENVDPLNLSRQIHIYSHTITEMGLAALKMAGI